MKKSVIILGIIICAIIPIMAIIIYAFPPMHRQTAEQSQKNYEKYYNALTSLSILHHLQIEKIGDGDIVHKGLKITLDRTHKIEIYFENNCYLTEISNRGLESFSVSYYNENAAGEPFDIKLFVEIVNAISGRKIKMNYISRFLEDCQENEISSKYEFEKLEGELVSIRDPLNFAEDWVTTYVLREDASERLVFWGATKYGTWLF